MTWGGRGQVAAMMARLRLLGMLSLPLALRSSGSRCCMLFMTVSEGAIVRHCPSHACVRVRVRVSGYFSCPDSLPESS